MKKLSLIVALVSTIYAESVLAWSWWNSHSDPVESQLQTFAKELNQNLPKTSGGIRIDSVTAEGRILTQTVTILYVKSSDKEAINMIKENISNQNSGDEMKNKLCSGSFLSDLGDSGGYITKFMTSDGFFIGQKVYAAKDCK